MRIPWRRLLLLAPLAPVLAFLAYGLGYLWYSAALSGSMPFASDFERGDLGDFTGWGARQLCCAHSAEVVAAPQRPGDKALRVTLRRDDPRVKGSLRAELRLNAARFGPTYSYAFKLFVPEDWAASPIIVTAAQWHGVPDKLLGERGRFPPLGFSILQEAFLVQVGWDEARVTNSWYAESGSDRLETLWSAPLERGRWIDWRFVVSWSHREDGLVEVWKDGVKVAERQGPNAYNDFVGPYLKFGVYNWGWLYSDHAPVTDERVLYFDDIRVE